VTRVFDSVDRNAEVFRDVMLEAAEEEESRLEAGSDSDENEE